MVQEDTFSVQYRLTGTTEKEALQWANEIAVEQTIEFPAELVQDRYIKEQVIGQITQIRQEGDDVVAVISYQKEVVGTDISQFLNVLFGNSSLQPGIWVENIEFGKGVLQTFQGPKYGIEGIRRLVDCPYGPMLHTAIKPMGSKVKALAEMAYSFALGGAEIIKDDHGIANQQWAPFTERVKACVEAVAKGAEKKGKPSLYAANCTADGAETIERAYQAQELGAGAVMIAPGLCGYGTMRMLAERKDFTLPILAHPAFLGCYMQAGVTGILPQVLYGPITRLAGADMVIFPSYGGRFSFTAQDCKAIAEAARQPMGDIRPILPSPGGGLTEHTLQGLDALYGEDVVYLIGGGIFRHGEDLVENTRFFKYLLQGLRKKGSV